jgi:hypothetical protein
MFWHYSDSNFSVFISWFLLFLIDLVEQPTKSARNSKQMRFSVYGKLHFISPSSFVTYLRHHWILFLLSVMPLSSVVTNFISSFVTCPQWNTLLLLRWQVLRGELIVTLTVLWTWISRLFPVTNTWITLKQFLCDLKLALKSKFCKF